jgi:hypothetical protein
MMMMVLQCKEEVEVVEDEGVLLHEVVQHVEPHHQLNQLLKMMMMMMVLQCKEEVEVVEVAHHVGVQHVVHQLLSLLFLFQNQNQNLNLLKNLNLNSLVLMN